MKTFTMKHFIQLAGALAIVGSLTTNQAMEHQEYAAELDAKQLQYAPVNGGIFYVKRCDYCPTIGISFVPGTLYFQDRQRISAAQAKAILSGGVTVFFDPASKYVTRVVYPTPLQQD